MQDVRSTVLDALTGAGYGSYTQYAEPVITALEGRERDISGVLIEYATQQGLSRDQAEQALSHVGLAMPAAQAAAPATIGMQEQAGLQSVPQPTTTDTEDPMVAALRDIQSTLAGLTAFARQNGYSG